MTLQTSEELKKHESNLSMILFAKKNPPTMEPKKYCFGCFSWPPRFFTLHCTLMLLPRTMKAKKSFLLLNLLRPDNLLVEGVKALGRAQGV